MAFLITCGVVSVFGIFFLVWMHYDSQRYNANANS